MCLDLLLKLIDMDKLVSAKMLSGHAPIEISLQAQLVIAASTRSFQTLICRRRKGSEVLEVNAIRQRSERFRPGLTDLVVGLAGLRKVNNLCAYS